MELVPFYGLTLLLWILSMLRCLHYKKLGNMARKACAETKDVPSVSVIMVTHNQESLLRQKLPVLLGQDYPKDFEVIVVDINSSDETIPLLEALEEEYPNLRHTATPATARDISLQRLALTLGIKAADNEWVVLFNPDCNPSNTKWLSNLCVSCTPEKDAVQAFVRYGEVHGWNAHKWQFMKLWQQMLWIPFNERHAPYRSDGNCICYRRSKFMNHQGFAAHANLIAGAEELMVNNNVERGRFTTVLTPQAILTQDTPHSDHHWRQDQVFFMETRRHMKHSCLYRTWYACLALLQPTFNMVLIPFAIWHYPNYYVIGGFILLWLTHLITRDYCFNYTAKALGAKTFHFTLPLMLNLLPLWDITAYLRWRFSNKQTFRKKFI